MSEVEQAQADADVEAELAEMAEMQRMEEERAEAEMERMVVQLKETRRILAAQHKLNKAYDEGCRVMARIIVFGLSTDALREARAKACNAVLEAKEELARVRAEGRED
jgi:hypothetical protein